MSDRVDEGLTASQRRIGQRAAVRTNLFGQGIAYVMTGALMMLFAGDVLGLSAARIAQVLWCHTPWGKANRRSPRAYWVIVGPVRFWPTFHRTGGVSSFPVHTSHIDLRIGWSRRLIRRV